MFVDFAGSTGSDRSLREKVVLLVDGACLDPERSPPPGYTQVGTCFAAAAADYIFVGHDVWMAEDPFEAFLRVAKQLANGHAEFFRVNSHF